MILNLIERTRVIARLVLGEGMHFQRRNLMYRLNRRVAGEVGQASSLMRSRKRRRERDLEHRRVIAPDKPGGKKKKLPRPKSYFGSRIRKR